MFAQLPNGAIHRLFCLGEHRGCLGGDFRQSIPQGSQEHAGRKQGLQRIVRPIHIDRPRHIGRADSALPSTANAMSNKNLKQRDNNRTMCDFGMGMPPRCIKQNQREMRSSGAGLFFVHDE